MKHVFIGIAFCILIFCGAYFLVWPNTYLSSIPISFLPKPLIRQYLENITRQRITAIVDTEEKQFSYADFGITLDVTATMDQLQIKNPADLIDKWTSFFSGRAPMVIEPVFIVHDNFDTLVSEHIPDNDVLDEQVSYDKNNAVFVYNARQKGARVDRIDLQSKLVGLQSFGKKRILVQRIPENSDLEKKVIEVNRHLFDIRSQPLDIIIEGADQYVTIRPQDIIRLFDVVYTDDLGRVDVTVDQKILSEFLATSSSQPLSVDWASRKVKEMLTSRYQHGSVQPVVLGIDTGPNTDGSLAGTYIEIDISQQKMYFFDKGELVKSYPVSTGLNYETPTGYYKIRNKSPMGYSHIFHAWMPWWMAFDYRKDIGAYLGIHELPYQMIGGARMYPYGNYIGSKKTGGCVALSPIDSQEVYNTSFVGMDIAIYP